jgi:hypothetical protein
MEFSTTTLGDLVLRLWERGEKFLWSLTAASAAVFAILCGGWFFRLGTVPAVFQSYGLLTLLLTVGLGILAGFRTWDGRPPKTVHLIADDFQSFWSQSRQKDGRITTQFCFRMKVTNLTDGPIVLSTLRLLKPRLRRDDDELARHILTRHTSANVYGFDNPIVPGAISRASCDIIVDRPIGKAGRKITAIAAISDQRGRWHKLKFEKLRSVNDKPV